jgi:hypothetical protein
VSTQKAARGSRKRVRASWKSSVEKLSTEEYPYLFIPYGGRMYLNKQFNQGDKVRVTVELLHRKARS